MSTLLQLISGVPAAVAYPIVAVVVLAESVLLVGSVVPTFSVLLLAGSLAAHGNLTLWIVIAVAAAAVVTGDALGHRVGRGIAPRFRHSRLGRRIPEPVWNRAVGLVSDRGGQAVFWGRFLPVVRTVVPHLTGAARLPYRHIAPYSVVAAVLWASAEAGTGYATARAIATMPDIGGAALVAIGVAAVAAAVALLMWRSHRRPRQHPLERLGRTKLQESRPDLSPSPPFAMTGGGSGLGISR